MKSTSSGLARWQVATMLLLLLAPAGVAKSRYSAAVDAAEAAAARGDWFEAVRQYDIAVTEKPDKKKVVAALAAAKVKAGAQKADAIQRRLLALGVRVAADFRSVEDLKRVEAEVLDGLGLDAGSTRLREYQALCADGARSLQVRQGDLASKLEAETSRAAWADARATLGELAAIGPAEPVYVNARRTFETRAASYFESALDEAEAGRDLAAAQKNTAEAASVVPSPSWSQRERLYAAVAKAQQAQAGGQFEAAYEMLVDANAGSAGSEIARELHAQLKAQTADALLAQAGTVKKTSYWQGISLLRRASELGQPEAQRLLNAERTTAMNTLQGRVKTLIGRSLFGQARRELAAFTAAFGSAGAMASAVSQCEQELRQRVERPLNLVVSTPQIRGDDASVLSSRILAAARERYPRLAMQATGLELELQLGALYYDQRQSNRPESKRYVASYRQVPNPQWAQWAELKRQYEKDQGSSLGSALIFGAAEPPRYNDEPVYDNFNYQVQRVDIDGSLAGEAKLTYRTFDGHRFELSWKSGSAEFSASDEAHPGFARADLSNDPLQVPSRSEGLQQLASRLVQQLVPDEATVRSLIGRAMAERADSLILEGKKELAIEYAATLEANGLATAQLKKWLAENAG